MASEDDLSAEERLIARYFRPVATAPGALGLVDDAAVLTPPDGCDLVLTTDGVIAGVHFFPDDPPGDVARKVLRMNLSDLAAKGARPAGFLMSVALPEPLDTTWLGGFASAIDHDAAAFGCPLLGGDTDRTPGPLSVSISAFGIVPRGRMVRRSTAKPGDVLLVTGTIGDSTLGLRLRREPQLTSRWGLSATQAQALVGRYLVPEPRNALAAAVLTYASAAMDVSDGLAGDLGKLCRASGVAVDVDVARVPLSEAATTAQAAEPALIETLISGGDDYEIVLSVAPTALDAFKKAAAAAGVAVTELGRLALGSGAHFTRDGVPLTLAKHSYSHF
jgi:thiamine-monophosphate kinase